MRLQRLDSGSPQHLDWVDQVMRSHPAFKPGQLYSRDEAEQLLCQPLPLGDASETVVYAALDRDQVLGVARILIRTPIPDVATIDLLMVHSAHTGQHVGERFLDQLSTKARHWPSVRSWRLVVLQQHEGALRFWHRQGFEALAMDIQVPGHHERVHVLQRPLRRPSHVTDARTDSARLMALPLRARLG